MKYRIYFISLILAAIIASPAVAGDVLFPESGVVKAEDGTAIAYDRYKSGSDSVIIICPGFFNSKENRWMRKAVTLCQPEYDVIIFDFRGHGKSGGLYTWSSKERQDLDAVLNYAVSKGYKHIGILGFSLGAAVAINEAAARDDIGSMVLISCPSRFQSIDFCFWEPAMWSDLKDNFYCKMEGKGARFSNPFLSKESPIDSIRLIKHTPVFFIHGDNDWVVKMRHGKKLYAAAVTEKKIEIIKGGLHAERLLESHYDEIKKMVSDWFSRTLK